MPRPGLFSLTPEAPEIHRKRSHSDFLRSQSRSQSPWTSTHQRPEMSSSTPNFLEPPLHNQALPPMFRFQGDGFDYRRPIMSTNNPAPSNPTTEFIDLTSDDSDNTTSFMSTRQLPPLSSFGNRDRFHRGGSERSRRNRLSGQASMPDIVDLESTEERQSAQTHYTSNDRQRRYDVRREENDDSDVVFVGEREVAPSRSSGRISFTRAPSEVRSGNVGGQMPRPQGGIGGLGELIRQGTMSFFQHGTHSGVFHPLIQFGPVTGGQYLFGGLRRQRQDRPNNNRTEVDNEVMGDRPLRPNAPQMFPPRLDFETQGFELIAQALDDEIVPPGLGTRNRQDSPPYKAPSAPPEGFTRKLEEETVVVCPNCNEELGRREYDDIKRQVWVVKQCGHVYCGECTRNRFVSSKAKGAGTSSGKTPTFKRCVVDDCDKPVTSRTAMLPIYL